MFGVRKKKVYRVNPHLIKKGLHMNAKLASMFNDIASVSLFVKAIENTPVTPTPDK